MLLFSVIFHVFKWQNAYIKDLLYSLRIEGIFDVFISVKEGGCTNACTCICIGSLAFPTEQIDGCLPNLVGMKYSWPCTSVRLYGKICPEVGPGRSKKKMSMRGPFFKGLVLQIGMQQQQTECILVS